MIRTTGIAFLAIMLLAMTAQAKLPDNSAEERRTAYWDGRAAAEWTDEQLLAESETQLKSELHDLQLCLERWAIDHEVEDADDSRHWGNNYPASISQLLLAPCCGEHPESRSYAEQGFYPNPFAGMGAADLNAHCVPYGWSSEAVGNFSYITQYNELGNVCAYILIAWGGSADSGHDIDGDGQPDGSVIMLAGGEPLDQNGLLRREWTEEQREDARLYYFDNGQRIELNWPK